MLSIPMFSWSIFILSLVTLACTAVQTSSATTLLPGAAVPTPFVGSTITQCVRSCVSDAADDNHCESATTGTCICIDPTCHQAIAACLQSKCSFTEPQPAFHDQLRRENKILANTSPVTQQAGPYHTLIAGGFSIAMSPAVGSGFFAAVLVNLMNLIC